jgi:hypothetical protein
MEQSTGATENPTAIICKSLGKRQDFSSPHFVEVSFFSRLLFLARTAHRGINGTARPLPAGQFSENSANAISTGRLREAWLRCSRKKGGRVLASRAQVERCDALSRASFRSRTANGWA